MLKQTDLVYFMKAADCKFTNAAIYWNYIKNESAILTSSIYTKVIYELYVIIAIIIILNN